MVADDKVTLEEPMEFGGFTAQKLGPDGADFDFYADEPVVLAAVELPADRLPKEIFYIPALLLLMLVIAMQRRRTDVPAF